MNVKWTLIVAALLLATVHGYRLNMRRVESVREKLIKSGNWTDHLLKKQLRLSSNRDPREPQRDYDDVMYVADIGVGTPQKYFSVIMDTGSADFWVPGVQCKSENLECPTYCKSALICKAMCDDSCCTENNGKKGHPCDSKHKFDPEKSSTYESGNKYIAIEYVSGSMEGDLAFDDVCIAGVCVQHQGWVVADKLGDVFAEVPFDGICGLGFTESAQTGLPPPVLHMVKQSLLEYPIFTVWLSRKSVSGDMAGAITFGNYDNDHCAKTCSWIDIERGSGLWMFKMDRVTVEDDYKVVGESDEHHQLMGISDTGTSLLLIPLDSYIQLAVYLNTYVEFTVKHGMPFIPCKDVDKLPNIILTINGKRYPVSPKNYMIQASEAECFLGVTPQMSKNYWILGTVWIRQYCHVHDMENQKIGLCEALM